LSVSFLYYGIVIIYIIKGEETLENEFGGHEPINTGVKPERFAFGDIKRLDPDSVEEFRNLEILTMYAKEIYENVAKQYTEANRNLYSTLDVENVVLDMQRMVNFTIKHFNTGKLRVTFEVEKMDE